MATWDFRTVLMAAQTWQRFCPLIISLWTCFGGCVPSALQLTFFKHKNVRWLIALLSFALLCNSLSCEMLDCDTVRKCGCQMRKRVAACTFCCTMTTVTESMTVFPQYKYMSLRCVLLPLCYFYADYQKQLQRRWLQRQLFCGLVFPLARASALFWLCLSELFVQSPSSCQLWILPMLCQSPLL